MLILAWGIARMFGRLVLATGDGLLVIVGLKWRDSIGATHWRWSRWRTSPMCGFCRGTDCIADRGKCDNIGACKHDWIERHGDLVEQCQAKEARKSR